MYKQTKTIEGQIRNDQIQRVADGAYIPFDPANTDAQQFAKWLKEGNVPEPTVEGEQVTQEWINQTIALLLPNG